MNKVKYKYYLTAYFCATCAIQIIMGKLSHTFLFITKAAFFSSSFNINAITANCLLENE